MAQRPRVAAHLSNHLYGCAVCDDYIQAIRTEFKRLSEERKRLPIYWPEGSTLQELQRHMEDNP